MKNSQGFTLVELLVVIALAGILAAIAAPSIQKTANNNLQNALIQISGNLKLTRAKAMASTSAYIVTANTGSYLNSSGVSTTGTQLTTLMYCSDGTATTTPCSQHSPSAQPASLCPSLTPLISQPTFNWIDTDYNLNLPTGVNISPTAPWQICFDARGMATTSQAITNATPTSQTITLTDTNNNNSASNVGYVQVYLGGAVQATIVRNVNNVQTTIVVQ